MFPRCAKTSGHQEIKSLNSRSGTTPGEAQEDKVLLAYSNLLRDIAAETLPVRIKKVRPGAIFELVKLGAERSSYSRDDRLAAISLIKA